MKTFQEAVDTITTRIAVSDYVEAVASAGEGRHIPRDVADRLDRYDSLIADITKTPEFASAISQGIIELATDVSSLEEALATTFINGIIIGMEMEKP